MTISSPPQRVVGTIERRVWVRSGVVEELDQKQSRLIRHVYEQIVHYYRHLYRTRPCYQHPLSLSRLMRLCRRNSHAVTTAIRYLANTIPEGSHTEPVLFYDRGQAQRNKTHRPYRIFLRQGNERGGDPHRTLGTPGSQSGPTEAPASGQSHPPRP